MGRLQDLCLQAEERAHVHTHKHTHTRLSMQGAGAMGRLQDLCLQAEERAHTAERRASVSDARCARAEAGLREATAAQKEREKALANAQVCECNEVNVCVSVSVRVCLCCEKRVELDLQRNEFGVAAFSIKYKDLPMHRRFCVRVTLCRKG